MRIYGELKVISDYTCEVCRQVREGSSSHYIKVDTGSAASLVALNTVILTPNAMPIGWASYGRSRYRCEQCQGRG